MPALFNVALKALHALGGRSVEPAHLANARNRARGLRERAIERAMVRLTVNPVVAPSLIG